MRMVLLRLYVSYTLKKWALMDAVKTKFKKVVK
jgi:hypothetical protein